VAGSKCPYCFSAIPSDADVCSHCARDVRRLITAEARVRELEALSQPARAADTQPRAWLAPVLLLFYSSTTALYWAALTYENVDVDLLAWPLYAIAFIAGGALAVAMGTSPISRIFAFGFAQPLASFAVLILLRLLTVTELAPLAPRLLQEALLVGAVVAAGGVATAYVTRVLPGRTVTLIWAVSEDSVQRFETIALRVAAVVTPLITLLTTLASLAKKGTP